MDIDGIIRKIDCRHKISIPASMMEETGLHDGDLCVVTSDVNGIHITKKRYTCNVCGKEHDSDMFLCKECMHTIRIMNMSREIEAREKSR